MKVIKRIPSFLRNKYFLATGFFITWMLFFDRNDMFTQYQRSKELREIEHSKDYFTKQIVENKQFTVDLRTNPAAIEKFAREKYLMKRDNEDLFIVKAPAKEEN
ncbi:MAG: FtsB family cell division protein [Candidatus Dadabacteria bacterium]